MGLWLKWWDGDHNLRQRLWTERTHLGEREKTSQGVSRYDGFLSCFRTCDVRPYASKTFVRAKPCPWYVGMRGPHVRDTGERFPTHQQATLCICSTPRSPYLYLKMRYRSNRTQRLGTPTPCPMTNHGLQKSHPPHPPWRADLKSYSTILRQPRLANHSGNLTAQPK